ncbi:spore coat protein H [Bacillus ectoiniformans]|uniref:CotH kinase family protein n=1 Tax=Bacillus ectoiniformans TaxID=1494429 RepID=UPI00195BB724|nr:CotH kinase family protein [Bacillus ectoiniformans]MBM7649092.1 spore coat protein H [Bacillus ectoiniformans]
MRRPPYLKTIMALAALLFTLLTIKYAGNITSEKELDKKAAPHVLTKEESKTDALVEDSRVYEGHEGTKVEHIYITVYSQDQVAENDHTFYELNESYKQYSNLDDGPKLDVLFQTGTAEGPVQNGFIRSGKSTPNATIELRGRSSRLEAQKSYKIRLRDNGGLWYGQNVLNLNKHADDRTRVRNKLAFDYFRRIPNLISLRTNFVHLHVKDLTNPNAPDSFEDYGMYTHIEQLNERGLAARGLNPDGHLYKVENFEFYRYPDILRHQDDPQYDKKLFESVLNINGSENHEELLQMLDDVNDLSKPFDQVFDTYFQEDNYLTWLAVNILFGNYDTMSTNYYLYSPLNSEKWYFLPWDFDKALGRDAERKDPLPLWQQGIQRYWGTVLHKRYLRDPANAEKLTAKIKELSEVINEETTRTFIDSYYPTAKTLATRDPDLKFLSIEASEFDLYYNQLETVTTRYKKQYIASLENPMPIFLHYERKNNQDVFTWEASHDLQRDELSYHFQLSQTPDFSTALTNIHDAKGFTHHMAVLPAGRYYWRVRITDSKGNTQIPFDYFRDDSGKMYWGVQQIIIPGGPTQ